MRQADRVAETCTVTGTTNPYLMTAAFSTAHLRFRDKFADGKTGLGYVAKTSQLSPNGPKIEIAKLSTLTYGSPADSLARGTILSSSAGGTTPVTWVASDLIIVYQAPLLDIFNALLQPEWIDNGAANLTITGAHFGQVIDFNVTAASRTATMTAGATLGHGFTCWVYGYGSTSNSVIITPASGNAINEQAADATLSVLGGVKKKIEWNDTRSKLIVS